MVKRGIALLAGLAVGGTVFACSSDESPPTLPSTQLSPQALYIRASLDVRGVRPTPAELQTLGASPEQLDAMLDALVDDARFGSSVRAIFADALRTRQDRYRFGAEELGLSDDDEFIVARAISEEPLNIMHHIALSDAPFSDIFSADYTIVEPVLVQAWSLEQAETQPKTLPTGTVLARYTDGRPPAGVLATNAFFWRHTSTVENANRGRSNAISRAFLCEDYLDRPIDFPKDVDLTDSELIREAIKTNPGCQACHATLDPFASHLWGFMQLAEDAASWSLYHPQNELMWKEETDAQPAFFGTPTEGTLSILAQSIGADERFAACTVQRVYEAFIGRPAELSDEGQLVAHRETFVKSGLSLKALVRGVLRDPAYGGREQLSAWGGTPAPVIAKLASVEVLDRSLLDLSGYQMTFAGRAVTEVDYGLRALAGGSERGDSSQASLGHALVHRRLAEGAARSLVDGLAPSSRVGKLLDKADLSQKPSAAFVAELVFEIQSQQVDQGSERVTALLALFDAVAQQDGNEEAWTALLTASFSDPTLAVY